MQLTNRRRLLHLSIVVLIMLETLRHFTESMAYSLTMLGAELLVLALIGYEVGSAIWRHWVIKRRLMVLFGAMDRGRELRESAPRHDAPQPDIASWKEAVKFWITETGNILRSYSPQADASFVHDELAIMGNAPQVIASPSEYMLLARRLNNLRSIMEKPDVYF